MDGRAGHGPGGSGRGRGHVEVIAHHHTTNRLDRLARPPADHMAGEALLVKDVPDRLRPPRLRRDGPHGPGLGDHLGKAEHAVLVGAFAGRDARPEHGGEHGLERGDVAHHTAVHESREMGHVARRHQGLDHLPVGRIPADHEHPPFVHDCCPAAAARHGPRREDTSHRASVGGGAQGPLFA